MIRGPLLTVQQGNEGTFVSWLEELGLKEFLRRYPIAKLVEWGWLVPQYRYSFPPEEFENEPESSVVHFPPLPIVDPLEQLWEPDWYFEPVDTPLWFLHPIFRPENTAGKMLQNDGEPWDAIPIPATFTSGDGKPICPYADYFFHWQGYALIDIIRASDCIEPILNTPDVRERAQGIARIAETRDDCNPRDFLTAPQRWGGLAQPMTWISHYRAYRDALTAWNRDSDVRRRGCQQLAAHLRITAEALATFIKDDLLRLADQWIRTKGRQKLWTDPAWACLQQDIYFAVEWLCYLNNKKLDDYLEEWSRPSHRQYDGTAELIEVLPFEFFRDRFYFLDMAPHYLKPFNEVLPDTEKLTGDHLKAVVDRLRANNYPFGGFLSSFRQMHDEISSASADAAKIDFRNRRPLDFYAMLAIRAEGCLMFALRELGELEAINPEKRQLHRYIWQLAKARGLSEDAVKFFRSEEAKDLVLLHSTPPTPIHKVMNFTPAINPREQRLVQAFLCCLLARNYFAHHHYLDEKLLRSEESAFMLGGIMLTVLFLLDEPIG